MERGVMTVELKGLRAFAPHGLYAEEAAAGNEFELNVQLTYVPADPKIATIEQTINYVDANAIVSSVFSQREELLETVAMKIMDELYNAFPFITSCTVAIQKLTAPIPNFIGSLGVTYSKHFK